MDMLNRIVEKDKIVFGSSYMTEPLIFMYGVGDYYMPMGVSMTSIVMQHIKRNLVFHVLTEGDSENFEDYLSRLKRLTDIYSNVCICVHIIDASVLENMPSGSVLSKSTYYRLLVARFVNDVDFVFFIDCDVICMHEINTDASIPKNAIVSAVRDFPQIEEPSKKRLKMATPYFNAGVLVVNISRWRDSKIAEKAMAYLSSHSDVEYMDQDALNVVLASEGAESIRFLPKQYNFEYDAGTAEKTPLPEDVVFLHYVADKPWCLWVDHPAKGHFFFYKNKSVWKDAALPQPQNYKQRHHMGQYYSKRNKWGEALKWYALYFLTKPVEKFFNKSNKK